MGKRVERALKKKRFSSIIDKRNMDKQELIGVYILYEFDDTGDVRNLYSFIL